MVIFQLTPSRRATTNHPSSNTTLTISTHALTEGDQSAPRIRAPIFHFNSRPHGGRRGTEPSGNRTGRNFNSRPHGGRQAVLHCLRKNCRISTHALTEGDSLAADWAASARGISTHALTEGDKPGTMAKKARLYFNSRPHGGRLHSRNRLVELITFQLTPSRRATHRSFRASLILGISTHALTEGDTRRYNPKQPGDISTHALTEGDFCTGFDSSCLNRFQLTPSRRATKRR